MDDKYNPFRNMTGIEDEAYFFNRTKETSQLLENAQNQISCSVVGGRKVGKTSLAKYIMRLTDRDPHWVKRPWIYLHSEWFVNYTRSEFFRLLLQQIAARVSFRSDTRLDWAAFLDSKEIIPVDVDAKLRELTTLGIYPVVIIDEFEMTLKNSHFDYGFYGVLRSFSPKLTYVTITEKTLDRLQYTKASTATSPFFNIFVVIPVEIFSSQDAQGLLMQLSLMGEHPFSVQDIEFLMDLSGCHPFFLQRAGFYLFKLRTAILEIDTEKIYAAVETEFCNETLLHYRFYWDNLTPEKQAVLKKIASAGYLGKEELTAAERSYAVELAQEALVVEREAGYHIVSRALRQFIVNAN